MAKQDIKVHHGILIFILMFFGSAVEPAEPQVVPLAGTIFLGALMLAFLFFVVRLVRKETNREKLFAKRLTLTKGQRGMTGVLFAYLLMIYLLNGNIASLMGMPKASLNVILSCVLVAVGAGFFEEYFARGYLFNLMQRILNRHDVQQSRMTVIALVTSIVFGLLYLMNLDGTNTLATLEQVFYAFCMGMLLCAIRIVSNKIWVTAVIHFVFDFSLNIIKGTNTDHFLEVLVIYSGALILSLIVLYLLDKNLVEQKVVELKP
ncbi:CPBP family intramembrane glutamic endopeptidase [Fructobacillus papyrifericola]|uniref:CPBP family intramembrane metalloprotease n=1 Tax=Fructobacillus papyrifericola TaxID=2713172 RepID=A0ABS5QVN1_9LACO|nr:CPBP family intramembrane glutamic endopeptidase [Fructobacillus papyrifericola]MBS9336359.1 CPBP family intramembrane metalloprotease [Fructobacillus papyrifericola]